MIFHISYVLYKLSWHSDESASIDLANSQRNSIDNRHRLSRTIVRLHPAIRYFAAQNYLFYFHILEWSTKRLLIKLSVHPTTVEELRVIRTWILTISRTYFSVSFDFEFNLAFLRLLFSPGLIKFHANELLHSVYVDAESLIELGPHICACEIVCFSDPNESLVESACSTSTVPARFTIATGFGFNVLQSIVRVLVKLFFLNLMWITIFTDSECQKINITLHF